MGRHPRGKLLSLKKNEGQKPTQLFIDAIMKKKRRGLLGTASEKGGRQKERKKAKGREREREREKERERESEREIERK